MKAAPTVLPPVRIVGYIVAGLSAIEIVVALVYAAGIFPPPDELRMAGWLTGHEVPAGIKLHTFLASMALQLLGGLTSIRFPATGYFLLAAGGLVGAVSILAMFPLTLHRENSLAMMATVVVVFGAMGFRQLRSPPRP